MVCVEFAQRQLLTGDFREIAAALSLVFVCFFCNFVFVAISFCVSFVDDFMTVTFVAALAAAKPKACTEVDEKDIN